MIVNMGGACHQVGHGWMNSSKTANSISISDSAVALLAAKSYWLMVAILGMKKFRVLRWL